MSGTNNQTNDDIQIPEKSLDWNLYGEGFENLGRSGKPEEVPVKEPGDDELLVRVDAVGVCFSDVKLVRQGRHHPKLHNQNLNIKPARLGHEVSLTVVRAGKNLSGTYSVGERLTIQPDIFVKGKSTAYGYVIPGGYAQYHIIGPEVLKGEIGSYAIPVNKKLGLAETALTEPWACVEAAYTRRSRLEPQKGGIMWIIGRPGDPVTYRFPMGKNIPGTILVTDVPNDLLHSIRDQTSWKNVQILEINELQPAHYSRMTEEITKGTGFDDIIVLEPISADQISESAKCMARRGTMNIIGREPLQQPSQIDAGRIHYDYTAFLGNRGPDIAASYGEHRNRCELKKQGTALFVGAGGPMGQMHVQRAIELEDGPECILAVDISEDRLDNLLSRFSKLADDRGKKILSFNPEHSPDTLHEFVMKHTNRRGADDVVVCAPSAKIMAESAGVMAPDGMLVLFAGVPNGTMIPLNMSSVYLHNARYTGTSGSGLDDQLMVIQKTVAGELSPNRSVAAIGGIEAVREGVEAAFEGRYPGKVVIYPQISGLKLTGLNELAARLPEIAELLGEGNTWTIDAEKALIEKFRNP